MFIDTVIPHCHVCMEELKMGELVVVDGLLKRIMHANCNYLADQKNRTKGNTNDQVS
ncbi:hypothetical protein JMM81_13170 [Bacillus sp. V3B]|uniref:hypothetical protein n=1 Tax=Bacillus sp. V3B TaxID=2804915 RepID=UPI00210AFE73|nr:hypothetical protein [Bacillus sp. V3B]MCQ6275901.1 hypothetical protein [Bacillus sp. V3B]